MIKIKNLYKIYNENSKKEFIALKNINLEIKSGSLVILKGASGSGKSTLLSIISTMQKPTSGKVFYKDELISKFTNYYSSQFRAKNIGFIFQDYNLFEDLSVEKNVAISLYVLGFSQTKIDKMVTKALTLANIIDKKDEIVANLSGGEKQRCAIARALANNSDLILCDEPTSALDLQNSKDFINQLKILKDLGKTIIVATHDDIFFNLDFVDLIVEIKNGELCE